MRMGRPGPGWAGRGYWCGDLDPMEGPDDAEENDELEPGEDLVVSSDESAWYE